MKQNKTSLSWLMSVAMLEAAQRVANARAEAPQGFDPQNAATTISGYSNELNQMSPGSPQLYAPLKSNQHYGRVRMSVFTVTFAAQASGTSFALTILPPNARILGGILAASATLANSATLSVGLAGQNGNGQIDDRTGTVTDTTLNTGATGPLSDGIALLKAAATQSTAQVPFALTQALGFLYETQKSLYLTFTTGAGAVTTETVTGYVFYAVD